MMNAKILCNILPQVLLGLQARMLLRLNTLETAIADQDAGLSRRNHFLSAISRLDNVFQISCLSISSPRLCCALLS